MATYDVIDAHVHTFKTREIGLQALSGWDASGCSGTPEELTLIMEEAGIQLAVQCNMTPARSMYEAMVSKMSGEPVEEERLMLVQKIADRIKRRNEWTCSMANEREQLIPFISVDPIMEKDAMLAEVIDKIDHSFARGLKIHPGEGRFFPDDPSLLPIYEILEKRGIPVISHGGRDIANPDDRYTRPKAFIGVLEKFPKLKLVIAHLGKDFFEESVQMADAYGNVFFDTSSVIPGDPTGEPLEGVSPLSNEKAVELIRTIGVDRVMFGSDYPWYNPLWDLKRFKRLDFSDVEKTALLRGNAIRVFEI